MEKIQSRKNLAFIFIILFVVLTASLLLVLMNLFFSPDLLGISWSFWLAIPTALILSIAFFPASLQVVREGYENSVGLMFIGYVGVIFSFFYLFLLLLSKQTEVITEVIRISVVMAICFYQVSLSYQLLKLASGKGFNLKYLWLSVLLLIPTAGVVFSIIQGDWPSVSLLLQYPIIILLIAVSSAVRHPAFSFSAVAVLLFAMTSWFWLLADSVALLFVQWLPAFAELMASIQLPQLATAFPFLALIPIGMKQWSAYKTEVLND